jgi:CBS domain-containing protein
VTQTIAETMTSDNLATVERNDSPADAAWRMAAAETGDVVVLDNAKFGGILTDRDIAIRLVAQEKSVHAGLGDCQRHRRRHSDLADRASGTRRRS